MERQLASTLADIRADHRARYEFAASILRPGGRVLDAACGIGYGTKILYDAGNTAFGVDIDPDTIAKAQEHYPGPHYFCADIDHLSYTPGCFDAIVSFETLEHIPDANRAVSRFAMALTPGSVFIASTPNEEYYPFKAATFQNDVYPHLRHYTPGELELLLDRKFRVESRWCQKTKVSDVEPGTEGIFLVYVCSRR